MASALKEKKTMAPTESYDRNITNIEYPWPATLNGIERIALSAQGGLQRILSAYFGRPITVDLVYYNTLISLVHDAPPVPVYDLNPPTINSASPETPIVQQRQVHLKCCDKIVCTATSTVRMLSPRAAQLCLVEQYAIGQMFRKLEQMPAFRLLEVGFGPVGDQDAERDFFGDSASRTSTPPAETEKQLWRKYTLTVPEYECEILEVFPTREMFTLNGEDWLIGSPDPDSRSFEGVDPAEARRRRTITPLGVVGALIVVLLLVLIVIAIARSEMRKC